MYKHGSAYTLIYGLMFLLFCGVLYIIFNQVNTNSIRTMINDTAFNFTAEDIDEADNYMGMWNFMPYVLTFVILMFFIIHIGISPNGP